MHGVLLVAERATFDRSIHIPDGEPFSAAADMLRIFLRFDALDFLQASELRSRTHYLSGMFKTGIIPGQAKLYHNFALLYSLPVIVQHLAPQTLFEAPRRQAEPYLYGLMTALMCVEAGPSTSFIYFQF